jgi:hypothetical protein
MTNDEQARVEQANADAAWSEEISGAHQEDAKRRQRRRELDAHDHVMAHGAAEAARDALRDSGPGKTPGAYTVHEARDRAAHVPSIATEPEV